MASPERNTRSHGSGMRASDADRERVATLLRDHYGAGRLSDEDLSERVEAAYGARSMSELQALTADLPPAHAPRDHRRRRSGLEISFRIHLTVYIVVNLMLVGIWAASGGGYFWPVWSILGWGIGVGCHGAPLLARAGGRSRHRHELVSSVGEVASSVAAERPSLRSAAAPDGTVTVLFSDIEGSTALNERLGDVRWLELLREHNRVVRDQVAASGGFEVKAQGDGFMIAFASARRAIDCARAIQEAIARDLGDNPDGSIRVRIGLHTGEAIREESDFYGRNVVVAARIAAKARGGEILASSVVKQLTESAGDVGFEDAREVELAGLAGTHVVYRVA
ncbi:MAG: eukaryotic-like serine/threonine-protein kinase [Thermoleophilaceae bacterium]|nr:eukaryotic-like serine/threonine-protein kinase [Thermoleophilaceae bacterium]